MLQPIETVYNGYRFRSRLEARWAVFFDMLNIGYEYEPEGFDLGTAGRYLPDFYLPEVPSGPMFLEIKPTWIALEEQSESRVRALAEALGLDRSVGVFVGVPTQPDITGNGLHRIYRGMGVWDACAWYQCRSCQRISITNIASEYGARCCSTQMGDTTTPVLHAAIMAARMARFS